MKKKKALGQHFLRDDDSSYRIARLLDQRDEFPLDLLEIGPGQGALTRHLLDAGFDLTVIEKDDRLPQYLADKFPALRGRIVHGDVLAVDWGKLFDGPFILAGNYPYNISSQITFKMIEHRAKIWQMCGMFQREVAQRIAARPSTKHYGVPSVLTQIYYRAEYCFDVPPEAFDPPPKVMSGVVKLLRRDDWNRPLDYAKLRRLVKTAFGMRRKKLSNALAGLPIDWDILPSDWPGLRAEQLSAGDYERMMAAMP